jgi:hypothetical protein
MLRASEWILPSVARPLTYGMAEERRKRALMRAVIVYQGTLVAHLPANAVLSSRLI